MIGSPIAQISGNAETIAPLVSAFAGLLSAVATIGLFFLYRQQKSILNDQKEFLKLERLPEIQLAGYNIEGDELEVEVSNYGHGLAKNVQFWTTVSSPDSDRLEPMIAESGARRVTEELEPTLERSINPHESRIIFRGNPDVAYRLDDEVCRYHSFSAAFARLVQEEIRPVWFQVYLVVEDQLNGCQSKPVFLFPHNPFPIPDGENDEYDQFDLETLDSFVETVSEIPDLPSPDCRD